MTELARANGGDDSASLQNHECARGAVKGGEPVLAQC